MQMGGASLGEQNAKAIKDEQILALQQKIEMLEGMSSANGGDQADMILKMKTMEEEAKKSQEKLAHLFFHNTCLLIKTMASKGQESASDVFIQDMYDEVREKDIPMSDWPMYIHSRIVPGVA